MSNELRIFVPVAIRALMGRLLPRLTDVCGRPVEVLIDLNPAIPERIAAGEAYDIALTNPPYVPSLISAALANAGTWRAFGRVPLAVGCREGLRRPVGKTPREIADLFRKAESIAYTASGTSGQNYLDVLDRFGLPDTIARKSHPMGGGEPVASVAARRIELAVAPLTTILSTPGLATAAIFPDEFDAHIDMCIFLSPECGDGAAGGLDFLTSPDLDGELAAAGVTRFELA